MGAVMTHTRHLKTLAAQYWDAIVIGAGPAGAIAASTLARLGRSVLLLERATFPRYKVCGGCLNLRALNVLTEAGLGDRVWNSGAAQLDSFLVSAKGAQARIPLPGGAALSRGMLDSALTNAARDAGTVSLEGVRATVDQLGHDAVRVRATTHHDECTFEARACIVASGLSPEALKNVAGIRVEVSRSARVGAGTLFECPDTMYEPGSIHMAVTRHAYVGLVRVEGNRLNVAAAFDTEFLRECGAPHVAAQRVLDAAKLPVLAEMATATWRGTPPLTRRVRPTALRRLLIIGDAARYIEPFTGEGIAWALESGGEAANLVHATLDDWSETTCSAWETQYARRFTASQRRCRTIAAGLRHPLITAIGMHTLRIAPGVAQPFVNAMNAAPPHKEPAP
jgi:flavin-dependent dehydrogenase